MTWGRCLMCHSLKAMCHSVGPWVDCWSEYREYALKIMTQWHYIGNIVSQLSKGMPSLQTVHYSKRNPWVPPICAIMLATILMIPSPSLLLIYLKSRKDGEIRLWIGLCGSGAACAALSLCLHCTHQICISKCCKESCCNSTWGIQRQKLCLYQMRDTWVLKQ